jgi:hypothetical protein
MNLNEILLEIEADALFRLMVVQIFREQLTEPNAECEEQLNGFAKEIKDSSLSVITQSIIEDQSEQRPEDVRQFMEASIASINTEEIANYITNKKAKAREGGSLDT